MNFLFARSIMVMRILLKFMHFPEVAQTNMVATTLHHYMSYATTWHLQSLLPGKRCGRKTQVLLDNLIESDINNTFKKHTSKS